MTSRTITMTDALAEYLVEHGTREPALLKRLRRETAELPQADMQIGPDQGAFLALLVRIIGARRCLEVGTFTGYSSTVVAMALPEDGRLVCCDISEEWTDVARRYWAEAGLAGRIELRLGPARETLDRMGGAFGDAEVLVEDGMYGASGDELLERLRRVPDRVDAVALVGHNPGIQDLAIALVGAGDDIERLRAKFPTAALAVIGFDGTWRGLAAGGGRLVSFATPKELD